MNVDTAHLCKLLQVYFPSPPGESEDTVQEGHAQLMMGRMLGLLQVLYTCTCFCILCLDCLFSCVCVCLSDGRWGADQCCIRVYIHLLFPSLSLTSLLLPLHVNVPPPPPPPLLLLPRTISFPSPPLNLSPTSLPTHISLPLPYLPPHPIPPPPPHTSLPTPYLPPLPYLPPPPLPPSPPHTSLPTPYLPPPSPTSLPTPYLPPHPLPPSPTPYLPPPPLPPSSHLPPGPNTVCKSYQWAGEECNPAAGLTLQRRGVSNI